MGIRNVTTPSGALYIMGGFESITLAEHKWVSGEKERERTTVTEEELQWI